MHVGLIPTSKNKIGGFSKSFFLKTGNVKLTLNFNPKHERATLAHDDAVCHGRSEPRHADVERISEGVEAAAPERGPVAVQIQLTAVQLQARPMGLEDGAMPLELGAVRVETAAVEVQPAPVEVDAVTGLAVSGPRPPRALVTA